jgi:hypothetical protein
MKILFSQVMLDTEWSISLHAGLNQDNKLDLLTHIPDFFDREGKKKYSAGPLPQESNRKKRKKNLIKRQHTRRGPEYHRKEV